MTDDMLQRVHQALVNGEEGTIAEIACRLNGASVSNHSHTEDCYSWCCGVKSLACDERYSSDRCTYPDGREVDTVLEAQRLFGGALPYPTDGLNWLEEQIAAQAPAVPAPLIQAPAKEMTR